MKRLYEWRDCTHEEIVHMKRLFTWRDCTHEEIVHMKRSYTWDTHEEIVHLLPRSKLYTWSDCTHEEIVHMKRFYTLRDCIHEEQWPCNIFEKLSSPFKLFRCNLRKGTPQNFPRNPIPRMQHTSGHSKSLSHTHQVQQSKWTHIICKHCGSLKGDDNPLQLYQFPSPVPVSFTPSKRIKKSKKQGQMIKLSEQTK